ncbi:MAG TPA: hypothetical protein VGC16_06955 [Rhizomicrobium sp.]
MKGFALAFVLLAWPAAAAAPLEGYWFGTSQPGDKGAMYIDHMLPNGEIHSLFRTCIKGKPQDDVEDGNWSLKGDVLTVGVITHDGLFMPRTDVYRITAFAADSFSEIYLRLNFPYHSRRVDAKFQMPSCEMVS